MVSIFPLPKLRHDAYLVLDVLMHIEYEEATEFIFSINKEGKSFLQNNFITIRNGFINNGLIPYEWKYDFDGSMLIERLLKSALTRNFENRVITL